MSDVYVTLVTAVTVTDASDMSEEEIVGRAKQELTELLLGADSDILEFDIEVAL
jgi:hypothetical protein